MKAPIERIACGKRSEQGKGNRRTGNRRETFRAPKKHYHEGKEKRPMHGKRVSRSNGGGGGGGDWEMSTKRDEMARELLICP